MPGSDPASILGWRLAAEIERSGLEEEACRNQVLLRGLDALAQDRRLAAEGAARHQALERLRADVVLVTATETEKEELRAQFVARDANVSEIRGSRFSYRRAQIGAWKVAAIHVEIGIFGEHGALARCAVARDETLAMLFVAVGTAFGIPGRAALGDVLVSDAVLFYDDRQVSESDGVVVERARRRPQEASRPWVERVLTAARSREGLPSVVAGTLLSGGAVIESPSYRDRLVGWHGPAASSLIVGGEMEAAGLVQAAGDRSWLLVKGVSDLADGATRTDEAELRERQRAAARHAAISILETLAQTAREVEP